MDTYRGKQLQPLGENDPLYPGDRVLIKFDWLINGDWFRAWQWSIIEKKLEGRKDWRVISTMFDADSLYVEIEILDQPKAELQTAGFPTVLLIVGFITAVAFALVARYSSSYLIFRRKETLVREGIAPPTILEEKPSVAYQVSTGFKTLGLAALVGVAGWFVLRWRRY